MPDEPSPLAQPDTEERIWRGGSFFVPGVDAVTLCHATVAGVGIVVSFSICRRVVAWFLITGRG